MEPYIVALAIFNTILILVGVILFTQSADWLNKNFNRQIGKTRLLWTVTLLSWAYYPLFLFVALPCVNFMLFFLPAYVGRYDGEAHVLICYNHFKMEPWWFGFSMAVLGFGGVLGTRVLYKLEDAAYSLRKGYPVVFKKIKFFN